MRVLGFSYLVACRDGGDVNLPRRPHRCEGAIGFSATGRKRIG